MIQTVQKLHDLCVTSQGHRWFFLTYYNRCSVGMVWYMLLIIMYHLTCTLSMIQAVEKLHDLRVTKKNSKFCEEVYVPWMDLACQKPSQ